MSFLRHGEIYQPDVGRWGRERHHDRSLAHRSDESPADYSWRVALQQRSLPRHQPGAILKSITQFVHIKTANCNCHLSVLSHLTGPPQSNAQVQIYAVIAKFLSRCRA